MNINKALQYYEWLYTKSGKKATVKELESFNAIVEYKELQETINLNKNESLAKLWVYLFVSLCQNKQCESGTTISHIDNVLEKSVYDWCLILQEQLPMLRFNSIGSNKYPLEDAYNMTKNKERNQKIIKEFETELTESLKYQPKEDDVIKFVTNQINRVINKHEK